MAAKLKDIGAKLRIRRHDATGATLKWLQAVVRGFFQYHAVPGNEKRLWAFRKHVQRQWLRQLQRRSQRSRWTWERFYELLGNRLPPARTLHPFPSVRFDAKHPRQEPCARIAPARVCAGGVG